MLHSTCAPVVGIARQRLGAPAARGARIEGHAPEGSLAGGEILLRILRFLEVRLHTRAVVL